MSGRLERWLLTGGTILFFSMLMFCPEKAAEAVSDGMEVFIRKLVPVLFPYMVLSHCICTCGSLDPLNTLLPLGKLFGMAPCAFSVFAVGHLCGYPVGAKMTAEAVRQKKISAAQGALLCGISAGASPAFLFHVVGSGLWGDIRLGMVLWGAQIVFGLFSGWLGGKHCPCTSSSDRDSGGTIPFSRCFCEAVGGSAIQMVSVGGYIVFFTLLAELLACGPLSSILASVLEFSTGIRKAVSFGGRTGLFLTGFSAGFGGLSVLAQTAHMLSGTGIPLRLYLCCRLGCGFFCGSMAVLYGLRFPEILMSGHPAADTFSPADGMHMTWFAGLLVMMWYCTGIHRGAGR